MKPHQTVALAALGLAACLAPSESGAQEAGKVGWSTGYYAGWAQRNYPPTSIRWDAYTHMCHFSITPNADGTIRIDMGLTDASMKAFVAEAKRRGVKSLISVGGAGTGVRFQQASGNPTTRAKLIQSIIDVQQKYGYDGIDLDWEELGGKTADYQALHREMRVAIDRLVPKPLFTVAIDYQVIGAVSPIHAIFDQMNTMSYWTRAANIEAGYMKGFVDRGVPRAKLGVGIGFDYEEGNPEVDCDPQSVKIKAEHAIKMGYGGVMVWAIEKDRKRYNGQEPSTDMLATFKPTATTALFGSAPRAAAPAPGLTVEAGASGTPRLRYVVPAGGAAVALGLFDPQGRRVADLVRGARAAGAHTVALEAEAGSLRPGAYVARLEAGAATESRSLVLP